ncbi:MAG: flavodoxin family protein [Acutalibacteraceae bacterium]
MKVLILMGSPRLRGNTAELCKYFIDELRVQKTEVKYIELEKMTVNPCRECYVCQDVAGEYGCAQKDDMVEIANEILWADLIVLATPIFSWYCTAKMKAVLDRHYGFNKYYGNAEGCLWEGKRVGIIATHGYDGDYATEPFETGVKRLCIHSNLKYVGMFSVQDNDNLASFQTEEAIEGAKAFARKVTNKQA